MVVAPGSSHLSGKVPSHLPAHAPEPVQDERVVPEPVTGAPVETVAQLPTLPLRLHAWHCAVQAVLQQTPSVQKVEVHSLPAAQLAATPLVARHTPCGRLQ